MPPRSATLLQAAVRYNRLEGTIGVTASTPDLAKDRVGGVPDQLRVDHALIRPQASCCHQDPGAGAPRAPLRTCRVAPTSGKRLTPSAWRATTASMSGGQVGADVEQWCGISCGMRKLPTPWAPGANLAQIAPNLKDLGLLIGWTGWDLNPRPPPCHGGALPDCATGPYGRARPNVGRGGEAYPLRLPAANGGCAGEWVPARSPARGPDSRPGHAARSAGGGMTNTPPPAWGSVSPRRPPRPVHGSAGKPSDRGAGCSPDRRWCRTCRG